MINQGISEKEINISSELNNEERLKLVLCSLIDISNEEYKKQAEYFYRMRHKIYTNENLMIKFILFFKDIYENVTFLSRTISTSNVNNIEETKNEINDKKKDNENNKSESIYLSDNSINSSTGSKNMNENEDVNNNDNNNEEDFEENDKKFKNLKIEDLQKESFVNKNEYSIQDENNTNNNQQTITIMSNKKNHEDILYISPQSEKKHKNLELSLSNSATFSISPKQKLTKVYSHLNIHNRQTITPTNISNNNKITLKYPSLNSNPTNNIISKKLKAEIQQTTGIYTLSKTKNPKIEKFGSSISQSIPLVKLYHPTNPIIDVSLNLLQKYITKISIEIPKKIIINNLKHNPPVNQQNELSIKKWLISLKLIKKIHLTSQIISLCKNGVLFCDIINRCDPRGTVIKGIIRSPFTKAQIKINLSKVVEYIRQVRLLYPYIKDIYDNLEQELLNENEYVIYNLIDGLYRYYNHIRRQNNSSHTINVVYKKNNKQIPKIDIVGMKKNMKINSDEINNFCYSNSSTRNQIRSSYGSNNTNNVYNQRVKQRYLLSRDTNLNDNSTLFLNGSSSINYNCTNLNNENLYFQQLLSQNLSNQQSPLTQISLISNIPNQKPASHSPSNSSIILSQSNNNSFVGCLDMEGDENNNSKIQNFTLAKKKNNITYKNNYGNSTNNFSKSKLGIGQKEQDKGVNCFLVFQKSNLGKMKKDLLKKEELMKSRDN